MHQELIERLKSRIENIEIMRSYYIGKGDLGTISDFDVRIREIKSVIKMIEEFSGQTDDQTQYDPVSDDEIR